MGPAFGPVWRWLEVIGSIAPELEELMWAGVAIAALAFCGFGVYTMYRDTDKRK